MVVPSVVRLVGLLILLSVNDIDTAGGVAHASAAQVVHRMGLHAFIVAQRGGGDACRLLNVAAAAEPKDCQWPSQAGSIEQ